MLPGLFFLNKMREKPGWRVTLLLIFCAFATGSNAQVAVEKTNPMKVYMHYMPWFETPETIGKWGWHWTMNTMDPNIKVEGQRQIASHYYPLIGPYASRDVDVIEYHFLLMKLSGVDGILLDWYGAAGSNGDLLDLLKSSNAIVELTDDFGMQFSVVLEDRFSRNADDAKANMAYLKNNYFTKTEYIRYGPDEDPLVCIFGPITFTNSGEWDDILPSAGEDLEFLPLWYKSNMAGDNADGEYMWVYQDEDNHVTHLTNFYENRAPGLETVGGAVYPGFNDYYAEGGTGEGYFTIPHYFGSTMQVTIDKAELYKDDLDFVQLITFNDFGEGTMIEPTVETGFDYLEKVQNCTGVSYSKTELELVYKLFLHRKGYKDSTEVQDSLDQASLHLRNLEIAGAEEILNAFEVIVDVPQIGDHGPVSSAMRIYPNPFFEGELRFELAPSISSNTELAIYDMLGTRIYEEEVEQGTSSLSLKNIALSPGVYFCMVNGENYRSSGKLVVVLR